MPQLVGRLCALCSKEINWVGDSHFCPACGAPVHNVCSATAVAQQTDGNCPSCGCERPSGAAAHDTPTVEITIEWWEAGLVGAIILSLATVAKVIRAVIWGTSTIYWVETAGLAAAVFGMGFLCGVIAWAGKGVSRQLGMAGDMLVGVVVMVIFFVSCMLIFDPVFLGSKFVSGGLPMLGLAVVAGVIGGAKLGWDLRKLQRTKP